MLPYDLTDHRPKVLPCGHTLCTPCVHLTADSCPFDRKPFSGPLPDNFFVLDLLQWEQLHCAVHDEVLAVAFCVQHLLPLCTICRSHHTCPLQVLPDFDLTTFLFKELNCDSSLTSLSNREKLCLLRKQHGLPGSFTPQPESCPELVWDRFQQLLPKKRAYDTYAWRLGISERQVEAVCLRVNVPVWLSGLGIGAPIDKNSLAKLESAWICPGDRVKTEVAHQLLHTTDLSASKPRVKLIFSLPILLQGGCWYTLVVRLTGGRIFAGRPESSRPQLPTLPQWEVKDPEDTGDWLVTGSSSRGGPLLQVFYYRQN